MQPALASGRPAGKDLHIADKVSIPHRWMRARSAANERGITDFAEPA
jgi:hypothetical protein